MKAVYHLSEDDIKDAVKTWLFNKGIRAEVEITLNVEEQLEIVARHSLSAPKHIVTAVATQVESKDYLD